MGSTLRVGGWVKTGRTANKDTFAFLELNDGTSAVNLQVLVPADVFPLEQLRHTGACVLVEGTLKQSPPEAGGQVVELHVSKVLHCGVCDAAVYPIAKKKITLEYLREKAHLRPRTNTIAAVSRVRNCLAFATHEFFQKHGFLYVHTPLITTSDCEGAGEMFQVTTLLSAADAATSRGPPPSEAQLEGLRAAASAAGGAVKSAKEAAKAAGAAAPGDDPAVKAAMAGLNAAKAELAAAEERARSVGGLPRTATGGIDYGKDFFAQKSYLTVSGQLQGEIYACALSSVYTFGPTFRAEDSHTSRHLAEFWMIEPEIAFADLSDDMQCAEEYVRHCCATLLERCPQDLALLSKMYDPGAVDRVKATASTQFARCSYTEAVDILLKAVADKAVAFDYPVSWGEDLKSEHERYLAEKVYCRPVIVYNYPKGIKAFYMRLNPDGKTVAAMDVLVPGVGELIGGSQREERLDILHERMVEAGLSPETYSWYLDLRRYGTVPHAGFGLGFERLLLFTTGMENIRDVIPFPRWPGNCT